MAFWRPKKPDDLNSLLDEVEQMESEPSDVEASDSPRVDVKSSADDKAPSSPPAAASTPPSSSTSPSSASSQPPAGVPPARSSASSTRTGVTGSQSGSPRTEDDGIPVEPTDVTSEVSYGIERAIELLRELPNRNIDLVMSVVARTLESANIDVASLIASAEERAEVIEGSIAQLKQEIGGLEEEIRQKKRRILELEEKHREAKMVKERLGLARGDRALGSDLPGRRATGSNPPTPSLASAPGLMPPSTPPSTLVPEASSERRTTGGRLPPAVPPRTGILEPLSGPPERPSSLEESGSRADTRADARGDARGDADPSAGPSGSGTPPR